MTTRPASERIALPSRQVGARFLFRLGIMLAFAVWPYLAGAWPLGQATQLLIANLRLGCGLCAVIAAVRHEPIARGELNHWDEALAFMALGYLLHGSLALVET